MWQAAATAAPKKEQGQEVSSNFHKRNVWSISLGGEQCNI